jgi:hypothetical protein
MDSTDLLAVSYSSNLELLRWNIDVQDLSSRSISLLFAIKKDKI